MSPKRIKTTLERPLETPVSQRAIRLIAVVFQTRPVYVSYNATFSVHYFSQCNSVISTYCFMLLNSCSYFILLECRDSSSRLIPLVLSQVHFFSEGIFFFNLCSYSNAHLASVQTDLQAYKITVYIPKFKIFKKTF